MRDIPDSGGSGGGPPLSFQVWCHRCNRREDMRLVQKTWLRPCHVRVGPDVIQQTQLCPACARWRPRYWIKVRWKLRIGSISQLFAPGFSACGRCRTNWWFAEYHATQVGAGGGIFVLCEKCWSEMRPEARLPYYSTVYNGWTPPVAFTWPELERAVLAGK